MIVQIHRDLGAGAMREPRRKKRVDFNTFVTSLCYGLMEWPNLPSHGLICPVRNLLQRRKLCPHRQAGKIPWRALLEGRFPTAFFIG